MIALNSPSKLHGAIENSFAFGRTRKLWRIDYLLDKCYLLVVSEEKPDFLDLTVQFGAKEDWETKSYDGLLNRIAEGQRWQFRLCANPVVSVCQGEGKRGKVHAVTMEKQKKWLLDRCERNGFSLTEEEFDVVDSRWYKFNKHGRNVITLRTATYEGELIVTDPERFTDALIWGIGREKAYGCSLLTITSPKQK